jgi:UDP-2,4-diacetamido-2,4,6-trideoxy-beta-L-altropyranose hydrolase
MSALSDFCNECGHGAITIAYESEKEENNWFKNEIFERAVIEADVAIIDSYLCDYAIYKAISDRVPKLIIFDDYNRIKYPKSIIINPNIYYDQINYSNQDSPHFGGFDFVILRKSFWQISEKKVSPKRILLSFGGSDYRSLSIKFACLAEQFSDMVFVLPNLEDYNVVKKSFPKVNLLCKLDEANFYNEISKADIVVSACGQILHECYSLNKKVIGICIDFDQRYNKEFYQRSGFLYSAYDWDNVNLVQSVYKDLNFLVNNPTSFLPKKEKSFNCRKNLERILAKFQ